MCQSIKENKVRSTIIQSKQCRSQITQNSRLRTANYKLLTQISSLIPRKNSPADMRFFPAA